MKSARSSCLRIATFSIILFLSLTSIAKADVLNGLSVPIAPNGYVPEFSLSCTDNHNYTSSLIRQDNGIVHNSIGVVERVYCKDGIISFQSFNLNDLLISLFGSSWWFYISQSLEYIVKDTTGLGGICSEIYCIPGNLEDSRNNYDHSVYLASSTYWTTVGAGPIFSTNDHLTWSNTANGDGSVNYHATSTATSTPSGNSNVLFIPGLEASRLYKDRGVTCTFGCEDQLWEPNGNSDVEALYLNPDGTSVNLGIYTRDIIDETNVPLPTGLAGQNIYKSFSEMMDGLVSDGTINRWEAFPYDWRMSVQDVVESGTALEDGTISLTTILQNLVASSTNSKVTIVAHSNGGLIAKALLKKLQDDKTAGRNSLIDNVDVLILVAVPQIGTATAVPALLHGYDQEIGFGWLMDNMHARELGRNMPSGYGLLPSKEYLNRVSASPVSFVDSTLPSGVTSLFVQSYGTVIDSYNKYTSFLFGNDGRVSPAIVETTLPIKLSLNLFGEAEQLHNEIDAWTPPASLRVIEVAGWGLDTVASFEYYPKLTGCVSGSGIGCANAYVLDQRPIFTANGDKTVVTPSAQYMSFLGGAERYWVDLERYNGQIFGGFRHNREHKDILEVNSLNNLIQSVISNEEIILDTVLKNTFPIDTSNRLRLSIHSPVTLDAYDSSGNHTGKVCPPTSDFCYVEENIINSSYLEFGEGKYINLPESELSKIKLQGTDIGTFTYESEKVLPDGTSSTSSFIDIPVTTQAQAEIIANSTTGVLELKLDVTGDGVSDFTLTPSSTFDPITYLQIMKATIDSLDITQAKKTAFGKRVDNIIKSIQKGKIDKAKLKADKFKVSLEKKISKPDPKKPNPKRLSKTDAQLLLDMLNKLLDNLGQ